MFFCCPFKSSKAELEAHVFNSIKELNQNDWRAVATSKSIYLSLEYLQALEQNLADEITFRFLIFYTKKEKKPVAIAVLQSLKFMDKGLNNKIQVSETRQKIKKHLFNTFELEILTCGTPFACGETGFAFTHEVSEEVAFQNLSHAVSKLQKEDDALYANVLVLKEFWPESVDSSNCLIEEDFHKFEIDVNMVMKIAPEWQSIEDYMASMTTKFRTKVKRAYKKSEPLEIKDLSENEIQNHELEIEKLYLAVLDKSDFKFGALNGKVFLDLKKQLKDQFVLKGYFLEGQMVGFSSAFVFNGVIDANYVGIDYTYNRNFSIYERMLYDYVELAIEKNCTEVRFGRTAEEIKSTVGAEPVNMHLYIKHRNSIKNKLLKPIFCTYEPNKLELRKPFKAAYYRPEPVQVLVSA